MQLSSTKRGLITGSLMILVSSFIYIFLKNFDNSLQFVVYLIYSAGIVWSILTFKKKNEHSGKFGELFSQGFKCFIVVTLMMVLYTYVFLRLHPELKDQMVVSYKSELIQQGNYTPAEMDSMIAKSRDYFVTMLVSMAIFGYLIVGAMVSAVASAFLMKRK